MGIAIAIILHLVAINIWVGGTFYSVIVLGRAAEQLDPAQQLVLMDRVFRRFFSWIWLVILVLLCSGGWMIYASFGGLSEAPVYVLIMASIGSVMMVIFLLIYFGPYRIYSRSRQISDQPSSLRQLDYIRQLNSINMLLGLCVVVIIGIGPYYLV